MDSSNLFKPADDGRIPLFERQLKPTIVNHYKLETMINNDQDIATATDIASSQRPAKPKLMLNIPTSIGPEVKYRRYVPPIYDHMNPVLETGVVNTGRWDTSTGMSPVEQSFRWTQALQMEGDYGWNDWLHWYARHPGLYPTRAYATCPCHFEDARQDSKTSPEEFRDTQEEIGHEEFDNACEDLENSQDDFQDAQEGFEDLSRSRREALAAHARQQMGERMERMRQRAALVESVEKLRAYMARSEAEKKSREEAAKEQTDMLQQYEYRREQWYVDRDGQHCVHRNGQWYMWRRRRLSDDGIAIRILILVVGINIWWFSREALIEYLASD